MTAVQWLIEELTIRDRFVPESLEQQAIKMEKQQIIDAYEAGEDNIDQDACHIDDYGKVNYYNETYGSKGSDEIK